MIGPLELNGAKAGNDDINCSDCVTLEGKDRPPITNIVSNLEQFITVMEASSFSSSKSYANSFSLFSVHCCSLYLLLLVVAFGKLVVTGGVEGCHGWLADNVVSVERGGGAGNGEALLGPGGVEDEELKKAEGWSGCAGGSRGWLAVRRRLRVGWLGVCWWVSVVASREEKAEASDCQWWRKRQCVVDFDGEKGIGNGWLRREERLVGKVMGKGYVGLILCSNVYI
ncbi:hypothetical protein OIU85_022324 [Salix viminalis]|uniref:Uncharacterized protein n=1 Tax=Salix viminalis TaxID=40686 RepID=A0A9Q0U6M6_SALVM|nr:hypothetical protein OIU85_022324 [Salix viminalis]